MINIKTPRYCKHIELLVTAIFSVLVDKKHFCYYFPHPHPPNFTIYRSMKHRILVMKSHTYLLTPYFYNNRYPEP